MCWFGWQGVVQCFPLGFLRDCAHEMSVQVETVDRYQYVLLQSPLMAVLAVFAHEKRVQVETSYRYMLVHRPIMKGIIKVTRDLKPPFWLRPDDTCLAMTRG